MLRVVANGVAIDTTSSVTRCQHGAVTVRAIKDGREVVQFVFDRGEQREFLGAVPKELIQEELVDRIGRK